MGDYDGAIALPISKKMGFSKLFQPNFIQKNIWFGTELDPSDLLKLWTMISRRSTLVHFNTNLRLNLNASSRVNLTLHLTDAQTVKLGYSKSLVKNINKHKPSLTIKESKNPLTAIELYKNAYGLLNPQLNNLDYDKLLALYERRPTNFLCIEVTGEGQVLAGLVFAKGKRRLHYILGAPNSKGRKANAISVAIDYIIETYANQSYILDFEGSSIPSVKMFYESFGAQNEPFYQIETSPKWMTLLQLFYNKLLKS